MALSVEQKKDIWELYNDSDVNISQSEIGEKFNISQSRVSQIANKSKSDLFDSQPKEKVDKSENIDAEDTFKEGKMQKNQVKNDDDFSFSMESEDKPEINETKDIKDFEIPSDKKIEEDEIPTKPDKNIKVNESEPNSNIDRESTEALLKFPSELYPILASVIGYDNFNYDKHFNKDFDRQIQKASTFLHPYISEYLSDKEQMQLIIGILILASAYAKPSQELYQYKKKSSKSSQSEDKSKVYDPKHTEKQSTESEDESEDGSEDESEDESEDGSEEEFQNYKAGLDEIEDQSQKLDTK